ncbi:MBL fold metallo-hydrolase [Peribacillus cavernae]|uniref:MBL fold metallo-hydrolase n=1 Tax=Peribacillus cavernae TaxID=1674310 RepID=A0A3S0VQ23_9BACI|nr:MBL fold metallo-hydrolase [Peribacillus cavernae]MDQ0217266.1 glyoxylase-like metal-dependent hydrolase (beta-lactamase superfamily II) [Peribacillus cavernae]RUQ30266.1 MBL fold metallo-hydrolase [Peribacillus cavernae]
MGKINEIDERILLIDGNDLNRKLRTGTYVIKEKELTIVETSASPSVPYVLEGLSEAGIQPEDIKYIILTHIHLDHAGGAGLFLQKCPNAKVIVHKKGARHLTDPSRLIAGAKAVYGDDFEALFDPIIPIPAERIIIKEHLETLSISKESTLTFYDTPGHANHHLSIHDHASNGMFSGDTVGIYYRELDQNGIEFYLPTTSPNQFNPEAMIAAAEFYENLGVEKIYFGHFGVSHHPKQVYKHLKYWLPIFIETAKYAHASHTEFDEKLSALSSALFKPIQDYLTQKGVPDNHPVYEILTLDIRVCSMGLIDYLMKQDQK